MWPVLIQPVYCSGSNTAKLIAAVVVTSQIIHTHTHRRGAEGGGVVNGEKETLRNTERGGGGKRRRDGDRGKQRKTKE